MRGSAPIGWGDGGERVRVGVVARAQIEMLADPGTMIKADDQMRRQVRRNAGSLGSTAVSICAFCSLPA